MPLSLSLSRSLSVSLYQLRGGGRRLFCSEKESEYGEKGGLVASRRSVIAARLDNHQPQRKIMVFFFFLKGNKASLKWAGEWVSISCSRYVLHTHTHTNHSTHPRSLHCLIHGKWLHLFNMWGGVSVVVGAELHKSGRRTGISPGIMSVHVCLDWSRMLMWRVMAGVCCCCCCCCCCDGEVKNQADGRSWKLRRELFLRLLQASQQHLHHSTSTAAADAAVRMEISPHLRAFITIMWITFISITIEICLSDGQLSASSRCTWSRQILQPRADNSR